MTIQDNESASFLAPKKHGLKPTAGYNN